MKKSKLLPFFIILVACVYFWGCGNELTAPTDTSVPYNLKIDKIENGRIRLTWSHSMTAGDTVEYTVAKKIGVGNWDMTYKRVAYSIIEDIIPTSDTLAYAYMVKMNNLSKGVETSYSTPIGYFSDFTAPTAPLIDFRTQEKIIVSWINHVLGVDGYTVDKRVDDGAWINGYKSLQPLATEFIENDFELYQKIDYRIYAYIGDSRTTYLPVTITPTLATPDSLSLMLPDINKVRLTWKDKSTGEDGFQIDRKLGGLDWEVNYARVDSSDSVFIDDVNYDCASLKYRVIAYQGEELSMLSDEKQVNIRLNLAGEKQTDGDAIDISMHDWLAVVADGYNGVRIYDAYDLSEPIEYADIYTEQVADRSVCVYTNDDIDIIYTLNYGGHDNSDHVQVNIYDSLNEYASLDTYYYTGVPADLEYANGYLYIADKVQGLLIFDVRNNTLDYLESVPTGQGNTEAEARNLFISNNRCYVANGLDGLGIIDISDPHSPLLVGGIANLDGIVADVWVENNRLYIADGEEGVSLYDISGNTLVYNKSIPCGGFASTLIGQGDYLYLTDTEQGLVVYNIADRDAPYIQGWFVMETMPVSLQLISSYALIVDSEGMKFIQILP